MLGFLKRLLRRDPPGGLPNDDDLPPVAIVLLLTEPRVLTRAHVAHALGQSLESDVPESEVGEDWPGRFRVTAEGYALTVLATGQPYLPKDKAPPADLRLRNVIERHEAAILIDAWTAPEGRTREDSTGVMGRLAAALSDDTTLGYYAFHLQRLHALDDDVLAGLAGGRAMETLDSGSNDAIIGVRTGDGEMAAAIAEAQRRWPEFVSSLDAGEGDPETYIVKAGFGEGENLEHMWFVCDGADEHGAQGVLTSDPFWLPRPRKGDRVRVGVETVSDWLYVAPQNGREGGGPTRFGDFTGEVIRRAAENA